MFLILLGAISIFALALLNNKYKKGSKYFCVITGILLILYAALRSKNLYPDTPLYFKRQQEIATYDFSQALDLYRSDLKNPSFYFLGWLVSRVFADAQYWFAFIAIVTVIPIVFLTYKDSSLPYISIITYLSLGFFTFGLTGLRQALAMAFIVPAYYLAKDGKFFKFLIVIFISSLFHDSAWIFLLIYPMRNLKFGWFHVLFFGLCLAGAFIFKEQFKQFIGEIFQDSYLGDYKETEKQLNFSGIIIQLVIFVFNLFYYKNLTGKNKNALILYNCAFLGLSFQFFSLVIAEMFRVSMYFSVFNIILIPLSIMAEPNKKWRRIEQVLVAMVLLAYIVIDRIPEYQFFWV